MREMERHACGVRFDSFFIFLSRAEKQKGRCYISLLLFVECRWVKRLAWAGRQAGRQITTVAEQMASRLVEERVVPPSLGDGERIEPNELGSGL